MSSISTFTPKKFSAFTKYSYTPEHLYEVINDVAGRLKCVMGVVNSAAYLAMMDAIDKIKPTPLYAHRAKKFFKKAVEEYSRHEVRLLNGAPGRGKWFQPAQRTPEEIAQGKPEITPRMLFDWYLDIGSCAYKRTAKQVEMLRMQIMQILTKHQLPHRDALSYVIVANALIEYSCCVYDTLTHDMSKHFHIDTLHDDFKEFRMTNVSYNFNQGSILLCTCPEKIIDVNHSEQVRLAFRAFENAIIYDVTSATSANEALEQNKELLDDDVYNEYREAYDSALKEYNNNK